MNNIHNLHGLDLSFFTELISIYIRFLSQFMSKKVFQMRQVVSILRSQQQVMLCSVYGSNLKMMYLYV